MILIAMILPNFYNYLFQTRHRTNPFQRSANLATKTVAQNLEENLEELCKSQLFVKYLFWGKRVLKEQKGLKD